MENMTIEEINKELEEINKELERLNTLKRELVKKGNEEKAKAMSVYIGKYIKIKDNPYRIAMIYNTDGDYLVCDYIEYQQQYFEIVSNDCALYESNEVDFITKDEFKNTVMNWVSEIFEHYNIES